MWLRCQPNRRAPGREVGKVGNYCQLFLLRRLSGRLPITVGMRGSGHWLIGLMALLVGVVAAGPAAAQEMPRPFDRNVGPAPATSATRALDRELGREGRVSISRATGTPRQIVRTDRALSPRDQRPAARIALDFVGRHRSLFGLSNRELAALGRPQVTVSPNGTRHLRWPQTDRGRLVVGADLRAHVTDDGRILAIQGGPLTEIPARFTAPELAARQALARARHSIGAIGNTPRLDSREDGPGRTVAFRDGSEAELVAAATSGGPRSAWLVVSPDDGATGAWATLVDAGDGTVLARRSLTHGVSGQARVWDARPTDPRTWAEFPDRWVSTGSALRGDFAHAFADVLGEGVPSVDDHGHGGEIPATTHEPGEPPAWDEPYQPIADPYDPVESPSGGLGCSILSPCSWSSFQPDSWADNLRQATVQAFVYANRFHDHLAADPIGFDPASGNFETDTPGGTDGDPVRVGTLVGAANDGGLPWPNTLNNARMSVFPDGDPPHMLLYLFGGEDGSFPAIDGNSAEHAAIVYHEYGHGLLGRLVTDSAGIGAMNLIQAGALNEGLSDFYALDYLEATGAIEDDPAVPGEILAGGDLTGNRLGIRESAIDCPVGARAALCPTEGGFTFADFGRIFEQEGEPSFEYHADGEIFSQTAWDLRTALIAAHGRTEGIRRARELVTEALRMAPEEPSYLDLRDAILLADLAARGGDRDLIWRVFAARGMGLRASGSTVTTSPQADFTVPDPDPGPPDPPDPPGSSDPPGDPDPPEPPDPEVDDRGRPRLRLVLPRRSLRPLLRRGLPLRIWADRRVRVTVTLDVPAAEARRRGLRRRGGRMRIARAGKRRLSPGGTVIRLRPRPAIRRKLRRARTLRVNLRVVAVDRDGRRGSRRLKARLTRSR